MRDIKGRLGDIKGRLVDIKGRLVDIKGRLLDNKGRLAAGLGSWSLGPSPGLPWARSQAGSGPGPRPGAGSPGLGPRLQEPSPATNRPLLSANRPLMSLIRPLICPCWITVCLRDLFLNNLMDTFPNKLRFYVVPLAVCFLLAGAVDSRC